MGRLIYSAIASLDGYVADADGDFDWAAPDEEVHALVNDLERTVGTDLYGRRMYETMRYWETAPRPGRADDAGLRADLAGGGQGGLLPDARDGAGARTRVEREFDPEAVRRMKASARGTSSVGGPGLAGQAIRAGLVDESTCSSCPSWWAAGPGRCPTASGRGSSSWRNAGSAAARFTCTTGSGADRAGSTGGPRPARPLRPAAAPQLRVMLDQLPEQARSTDHARPPSTARADRPRASDARLRSRSRCRTPAGVTVTMLRRLSAGSGSQGEVPPVGQLAHDGRDVAAVEVAAAAERGLTEGAVLHQRGQGREVVAVRLRRTPSAR